MSMSTSDDEEFYDPPSSPLSDDDPVSMELAPEPNPVATPPQNVTPGPDIDTKDSWDTEGNTGGPRMEGSLETCGPVEVCRKGSLDEGHGQPVDLDITQNSSIDGGGNVSNGPESDGLKCMESFASNEPDRLLHGPECIVESVDSRIDSSVKNDTDEFAVPKDGVIGSNDYQINYTESLVSKDNMSVSSAEAHTICESESLPLCDTEPLPHMNGELLPLSHNDPRQQNNCEPLPLSDRESLTHLNDEPFPQRDTDPLPQTNDERLPAIDTEPLPINDLDLHPLNDTDLPTKKDCELHPICDTEPLPVDNDQPLFSKILRTHPGRVGEPVPPNANSPAVFSDIGPDDLDALVQMQNAHDISNTSNIFNLDRNLSMYVVANMDDPEGSPDSTASPEVLHDVFTNPLSRANEEGTGSTMQTICHTTPTINSTDVTLEKRHTSTSSVTLDNISSSTPLTEKPRDSVMAMDTTNETAMIFSDTNKCSDVQKSTTPDELAGLSNEDSTSAKSSTFAGLETDSNAEKNAGAVSGVCHNRVLNSQQASPDDKEIDIRSDSTDRRSVVNEDAKYDVKTQSQSQEAHKARAEKTDHNANVEPLDKKEVPSMEGVPQEFLSKMEALGSKSQSLGSLTEKSSVTIGSLTASRSGNKLSRQDTFPFKNNPTTKEDRTIKIVRVSSVDAVAQEPIMDKQKDVTRSDKGYTESTKATLTAMRKSLTENDSKAAHAKQATKNDTGMKDSIDSKTVLKLLDNLERHLEHERKLRERADDWAEFLTVELEAHIEARTKSEEKYTVMREKFLQYKAKSSAKYKRLVADHKALLLQIRDITRDDGTRNTDVERTPSPLLRRNRSQPDRSIMMSKRNALLIRGSRREQSSEEEEGSGSGESQTAENKMPHKENGNLPTSIADVRTGWQKSLEEKKQVAAKLEKDQNKPEKSPNKVEPISMKAEVSPLKTEKSPPKTESSPKTDVRPKSTDSSPPTKGLTDLSKKSPPKTESSPKTDVRPKSTDFSPPTKGITDLSPPTKGLTRHGSLRSTRNVYVRRSSSTSQSDTDAKEIRTNTSRTPPTTPQDKTRSIPERLTIPNSNNTRHIPKTSTPTSSVNPKSSKPTDTEDGPGSGNSVIDVRAFTNMWEKKLAKLPFEAQTSKGTPDIPGRNGEATPTFASVPTSPVTSATPSRRSSRQNGDDTFDLDDDDDDLYLSAQEDEFDDSFPKSEGVLNESINTRDVRNMFQSIVDSSMNTPKSEAPRSKLSYSASTRETRTKFANKGATETQSARPPQRTRARAKTLTEGIPKMDSVEGVTENGASGSERSAKFSSLMSKWQKQ